MASLLILWSPLSWGSSLTVSRSRASGRTKLRSPKQFIRDASRQYVINEYEARYADPTVMGIEVVRRAGLEGEVLTSPGKPVVLKVQ